MKYFRLLLLVTLPASAWCSDAENRATDEQAIRRAALQYNVPCVTTMTGAQALVEALGSRANQKEIGVYALQELHAVSASAR